MASQPEEWTGTGERYQTREILTRLGRDRRRARLLFACTVLAIASIVAGLVLMNNDRNADPLAKAANGSTSKTATPRAAATSAGLAKPLPSPSVSPAPTVPAPPPPPPQPVATTFHLPRAAPLWLDGAAQGMKKTFVTSLTPGKHHVKIRVGRRIIEQDVQVEVNAPRTYRAVMAKRRLVTSDGG